MSGATVIDLNAFRDFREGMAKLRDGEAKAGTELLRQAFERDPDNPYYVSYYGLGLAHAESKWAEAEHLCHTAVCRARRQAQLYLNLAEVYLISDRRQAAADTISRGLHYLPDEPRLQAALGQLATRRGAVLQFLPRSHSLNKQLGRIRHRVLQVVPRRKWRIPRPTDAQVSAPNGVLSAGPS